MQDMQSVNRHALASVPIKHPHKLQQICPALIKYPHELHQTVVCSNQAASRKPFICFANWSCMKRPKLGICQIASSRCYSGYRCELIDGEHTVRIGCCLQAKRKNGKYKRVGNSGEISGVSKRALKRAQNTQINW